MRPDDNPIQKSLFLDDAEQELKPFKTPRLSPLEDVPLTKEEIDCIDTEAFQRLHSIKQLGAADSEHYHKQECSKSAKYQGQTFWNSSEQVHHLLPNNPPEPASTHRSLLAWRF